MGVEFVADALELPVFRHPSNAAYILGPEIGSLSPEIQQRCRHVVKIPSSFCLNMATTGAIALYDRIRTLGNYGERPVSTTGESLPQLKHVQGVSDPAKTKKIA